MTPPLEEQSEPLSYKKRGEDWVSSPMAWPRTSMTPFDASGDWNPNTHLPSLQVLIQPVLVTAFRWRDY